MFRRELGGISFLRILIMGASSKGPSIPLSFRGQVFVSFHVKLVSLTGFPAFLVSALRLDD